MVGRVQYHARVRLSRRRALALGGSATAGLGLAATTPLGALAETASQVNYLRIGTGDVGGVYFHIGGMIANIFSDPTGDGACNDRTCGVAGLVAVAQTTQGSVDNIGGIAGNMLEAALSQADVAYWAFHGEELFSGNPVENIRTVANLYSELVHVVVPADSEVASIADLAGRRVVVGQDGSGTQIAARMVLDAHGLSFDDIEAITSNATVGVGLLIDGEADGLILVAGAPAPAMEDLAANEGMRLLPIRGAAAEAITAAVPFFSTETVKEDIYENVRRTDTLAVGAQLIVRAELDDELVYGMTRSLWHPTNRSILNNGHPLGQRILLETALKGIGVPLHAGAAKYYAETLGDEALADTPQ